MGYKILAYCLLISSACSAYAQPSVISGSVIDAETREPLAFASIIIEGTSDGATTSEQGTFTISIKDRSTAKKLVASFVGYKNEIVSLSGNQTKFRIFMQPDANALKEVVVVSGTMKEVTKMNSAIPVEIYSPALFLKNPTPSIFESLGMINGVQPQLNCNVCNTGDIHINGMEGPYTMVLIDGMPVVSSLSTVYGLAGIPNSMVKRIEVVKGPASTLYGSEAVGGLVNIITKDPDSSPVLKTDISATSLKEYNVDIASKWKVNQTQSLVGINYFNFKNRLDINHDNFTDVTQQQRISVFNKWSFHRKQDRSASLAIRYVYEDRWGGELQWTRKHRGTDIYYGESIYTNRVEVIGNYQLPVVNQKIILDYSYNNHIQDSYYGLYAYLADQQVSFAQLRWDKKIGRHDLLAGIPFRYIYYDDNTPGTGTTEDNKPMETFLPGIFIQDEISFNKKVTLLTGLRYDHHNLHGNIFSPRVSMKYSPAKSSTFRLSTGNGFRVVNLFTEDHAALTGAREVIIEETLAPEESWNINLNYTGAFVHSGGFINLDASIFYTYFTNKIVGDFMVDPEKIIYSNLDGHAVSKGITINAEFAFTNSLKVMSGVTLMDVYQMQRDTLTEHLTKRPQLFAPGVSGTYSISYSIDRAGLIFDLTGRLNGPMHLPVVPKDERPAQSPWFTIMNFQVTKTFMNGLEIYAGAKNLLNFIPEDPLLRPFDPFDRNITVNNPKNFTFDTSYNYAPVQGIKAFAGLRYTIQ